MCRRQYAARSGGGEQQADYAAKREMGNEATLMREREHGKLISLLKRGEGVDGRLNGA